MVVRRHAARAILWYTQPMRRPSGSKEFHGPPFRDDPSLTVVARGKVYDSRGNEQPDEFAATLYDGPRGNLVFNAGTCWWNMLLSSPPGFVSPVNKDFARQDPRVQRITKNLIARMIGR